MTIADSRVVGWQWEHFVNNGFGDGYWIDQSGHEYPEILDQSDLNNPNKYRNMTALVPLSLLAEAEREIERTKVDAQLGREVDGWVCMNTPFTGEPPYVGNAGIMLALRELKADRDALQSRLDAVVGLADRWEKLAETHGIRAFTGNDHRLFANELRAALGGESRGNEEVVK